ncbi:MAG TPA: hypothetical protein VE422_24460 [Terriglobia bacterium]|nr:hypothetical protein [Terriglobia bacterium]
MTDLKWCRRTTGKIADLLGACGFAISANTIARLLHGMKFSLRVNQKKLTTSSSSDRNLQFDYIAHWWQCEGLLQYPRSRQLLILADSGGSNGCRRRTWKIELQTQLADRFALNITVAHYPTGASKWNPIEHRLFSEISKNWAGEPLDSYQKILKFIRTSSTKTGLAVSAYLDRRHYSTGIEPSPEQLYRLRLEPHDTLPKWNYTIKSNSH